MADAVDPAPQQGVDEVPLADGIAPHGAQEYGDVVLGERLHDTEQDRRGPPAGERL
ncbi:hypothetical protein O1R50_22815 [Glycomyces luteolus]|uniref:Uncharacterized protein n=1 Tax=Glycomyces luteolus TaxID=2670330 RepID=A0A9X3SS41_9ACTN|nr:hypothetical protein [Glycomyces luteolus]MDA1362472.1 hypothetical protein [Glycomyces luteolus]